jgi:hypothetical protein
MSKDNQQFLGKVGQPDNSENSKKMTRRQFLKLTWRLAKAGGASALISACQGYVDIPLVDEPVSAGKESPALRTDRGILGAGLLEGRSIPQNVFREPDPEIIKDCRFYNKQGDVSYGVLFANEDGGKLWSISMHLRFRGFAQDVDTEDPSLIALFDMPLNDPQTPDDVRKVQVFPMPVSLLAVTAFVPDNNLDNARHVMGTIDTGVERMLNDLPDGASVGVILTINAGQNSPEDNGRYYQIVDKLRSGETVNSEAYPGTLDWNFLLLNSAVENS